MHLVSCTNTHRDVTNLVNHGIVKNAITWISWERNIVFLRHKRILNLCFRWHILRSYRFVAEVTFKGPNYATNVFLLIFSQKYLKSGVVVFLTLNICRKFRISVISSSQWNMSLVSTFWVIWRKVMSTREAPDFWGLHKNRNCGCPLAIRDNVKSTKFF